MVARTLTSSQVAALRLATVDEMVSIASAIPQVDQKSWARYNCGPATFLEVSPGAVRIRVRKPGQDDHERDLADAAARRNVDAAVTQIGALYNSSMASLGDVDLDVLSAPDVVKRAVRGKPSLSKRGKIVGWSRKSRNRMQLRLGSLDWTPLFEDGLEPAMITLTLPGNWEELAPTPVDFRAMVARFRSAYVAAWGTASTGVWKLEFQRRGAPHLHILMTPPAGVAQDSYPYEFRHWLSMAWARSVDAKGEDRVKHEKAGTGVDYVGEAYRNPRLIAKYFGKHGTFNAKEYQNEMPRLWLDAIDGGASGIQFWGVWGLKKAVGVLQLSDDRGAVDFGRIGSDSARIIGAEDEERHDYATDSSTARAGQRAADAAGSSSTDAVRVQRHLRRLSRSLAYRGQKLVRNKRGQLVLPSEAVRKVDRTIWDWDTGELRTRRTYRIGYYHGGGGYLLVADGRVTGRDVQRLLDSRSNWSLAV